MNRIEKRKRRILKSELLDQFERFIDELLCQIYIIGGDIELMRAAMPKITSGVYLQLRNDGRVYVGEAVDIVHRQTEHLAEGVKIWAFAVTIFPRISEKARKAYENVVAEVTGDGQVTEEEQGRADAARERYSRLESVRSRYEGRLDQARKATEAASSRQTPALGGFYAKALQNLGATQVQDKTLKAAQATAQNTKRVVELLRQQAEHGLAFT